MTEKLTKLERMERMCEAKKIIKELLIDSIVQDNDIVEKQDMLGLHSKLVILTQYHTEEGR